MFQRSVSAYALKKKKQKGKRKKEKASKSWNFCMKSDLLEISQKTLDCSPKGNSCILVHSDDLRQT